MEEEGGERENKKSKRKMKERGRNGRGRDGGGTERKEWRGRERKQVKRVRVSDDLRGL